MLLYHGSKEKFEKLRPQQAQAGEGVEVPKDELQKAIYLTPNYKFAVACAARPDGVSNIDDKNGKIEFEKPETFNPEQDIYIYCVNSENVPPENLKPVKDNNGEIDKNQFVIINTDELLPDYVECKKAIEVEKYYELTNWKKETVQENSTKIR
jgi:hypothetical protein